MSSVSEFESQTQLLKWLEDKGIPRTSFSDDGRCVVTDDSGRECLFWLPKRSTTLRIFIHLDELDSQQDMDVLLMAMAINLDPERSSGLTLGYNPQSSQLIAGGQFDIQVLKNDLLDGKLVEMFQQVEQIKRDLDAYRRLPDQPSRALSPGISLAQSSRIIN